MTSSISNPKKAEIPFELESNELLVRGIFHPIFYSNSKGAVRREAFLPAPERADVSLLRHKYTNDNFCKNHSISLKIGDNEYCGMATFQVLHVATIVKETSQTEKIDVEIKGTPIDEYQNYIYTPPVFIDAPGLPMHADMIYETPMIKGVPQTKHRQFASKLAKISNYFEDPYPKNSGWRGPALTWES